jgi:hypothetical protein
MAQIYNNNLSPTLWGAQGNTNSTQSANTDTAMGNVGELQYNNGGNLDGVNGTSYANGVLSLGNVSNLAISGGIPGQFLGVNDVGQLTFKETTQRAQPQIKFTVTANGINQSFPSTDLDLFADGTYAQVFRNGVLLDTGDYTINNSVLSIATQLFAGDIIAVGATSTGAKPVGSVGVLNLNGQANTYLNGLGNWANLSTPTYGTVANLNLDGNTSHWLRGDGTFTELVLPGGNIGNVNLNGNTVQYLRGDGNWSNIPVPTGNIANQNYNGNAETYLNGQGAWVAPQSGGIPGGISAQLQYNNNGNFGGITGTSYNGTTLVLPNVANLQIGGTNVSSVLRNDGTGALSWANVVNYSAIPRIEFDVVSNGTNQTFTDANLASYTAGTKYMSVFRNGVLQDDTQFTLNGSTLTWTGYLRAGDAIDIAASAVSGPTSSSGNGSVTQVSTSGSGLGFSLTGGPITTIGTVTLTTPTSANLRTSLGIGNVANLNLNGNGSTYLRGNGSFGVVNAVAGPNTSIQFNDGNVMAGTANMTYDSANNTFTVQCATSLLDNVTVEGSIVPLNDNLYNLGSPSRRFAHIYVGPNSLSVGGTSISETAGGGISLGGEPSVTAPNNTITMDRIVANTVSVAGSNVGNIATINLDGNVSNILTGNGSWVNGNAAQGNTGELQYNSGGNVAATNRMRYDGVSLTVSSDTSAGINSVKYSNSSSSTYGSFRARGTKAAPLPVQVGDAALFNFAAFYTGNGTTTIDGITGWASGATTQISANVIGLPTGAGLPPATEIRLITTSNTSNTQTSLLQVSSSYVNIGLPNSAVIIRSAVPATSTSQGSVGQVAFDGSYIYYCHTANTWVRAPLSTW